jgi:DNA-3-methyladenine glycosylase II
MPRPPAQVVAAAVRDADPAFAKLVARHGPPPARRATPVALRFATLASAILHQQLAGAAALAIHGRVVDAVGSPISAEGLLAAGHDVLAACGVSGPKRASLFDLAHKTLDGSIDLGALGRRGDDEIREILTTVRGIGPWTADMFSMFTLARPDVWPTGDYGVRAGWTLLHGGGDVIAPRALAEHGDRFRPYRSAAAWYCWRAVEDERDAAQPS